MSEVTVFSDKLVARFVMAGAVLGFAISLLSGMTWGWIVASTIGFSFFGLLVFGSTVPLAAWYKYFRVQRGFSAIESVAMVAGGLCVGALGGVVWHYIAAAGDEFPLFGWVLTAVLIVGVVTMPFALIKERRDRAKLKTYIVKE